jgi:hypothetical protein
LLTNSTSSTSGSSSAIDFNLLLTAANVVLFAVNLILIFKQLSVQRQQFRYERKPQIIVQASSKLNRVQLELTNNGDITARNISLDIGMTISGKRIALGKFSLGVLNPEQESTYDITDSLFAVMKSEKLVHSYGQEIPTKVDEVTGEQIWEDIVVNHLRHHNVSYALGIKGSYGSEVNPDPIFSVEYAFQVEMQQLEYDYEAGKDYLYDDDFETSVRPETGTWKATSPESTEPSEFPG